MESEPMYNTPEMVWDHLCRFWLSVNEKFGLSVKVDMAKEYAIAHPVSTLLTICVIGFCSVPIGCFLAFAAGTIAFTFMGFMFVEGTILSIAAVLLVIILLIVGFISFSVGGVLIAVWFLFTGSYKMLLGKKEVDRRKSSGNGHCYISSTRNNYDESEVKTS